MNLRKFEKIFFITIICISSFSLALSTEPLIKDRFFNVLQGVEIFASFLFFIEYLWRIYRNKNKRLRYVFSIMGIIDLFSFLPSFLTIFNLTSNCYILLFQLLRLIKLTRYSHAFHLLAAVLKDEAESLMVAIILMFIIVIFAAVGIYAFEHNVQPDVFGSVPRAMWWAVVTLTTVGYGDVTPITPQGKIFATLITIAGVGLVSLPAGIIASGFTEQFRLRREKFEDEVEKLIKDDRKLSEEDLKQLEKDRQLLGINKDKADFIIEHVKQKELT